jgi:lytic murein transglycosylase
LLVVSLLSPIQASAAAKPKSEISALFQTWLSSNFWPIAKKGGVTEATFKRTFASIALNYDLPDLILPGSPPPKETKQSQAEFSSPGAYFSEKRLGELAAKGKALAYKHAALLSKMEKKYGVPGSVILAIWGRETNYGAVTGKNDEISVLATKAFMSTRPELFQKELIAALLIIQSGKVTERQLQGSWAGAMGQPQFMPSSYLKYAVDFDGNGSADIWNSIPDSFASIANYLKQKGWQAGWGWGVEVAIPDIVSCAQEGPDLAQPLANWTTTGIAKIDGSAFPKWQAKAPTMMLVPAGTHGPAFLVSPNFYVIKEYNNSDLYALFIGNLADRIAKGTGGFSAPFGDVGKMLRSDVAAIQRKLEKLGKDVGGADGFPGYKTRREIGRWQERKGMKPTCFPDPSLKTAIK